MGIVALLVYKWTSNQSGIDRAKDLIKAYLLEIRIYRDDPLTVLGATGRIAIQNAKYLGFNIIPMLVMMLPMLVLLIQLESHFAFGPAPTDTTGILHVALNPAQPDADVMGVTLDVPKGIHIDAPPVRTTEGDIFWRLRLDADGDHVVRISLNGDTTTKTISVGGAPRKVSIMRTNQWIGILYPGEAPLTANNPIQSITFPLPETELSWLPGGELGIVLWFLGISLLVGYAFKDVFGVSL